MKNNQQEPDTKSLWGLKKIPLTHKPKEDRILDTVFAEGNLEARREKLSSAYVDNQLMRQIYDLR